jgi:hypothetical protein
MAADPVDPVERTEAVDELRRMAWKRHGIIAKDHIMGFIGFILWDYMGLIGLYGIIWDL